MSTWIHAFWKLTGLVTNLFLFYEWAFHNQEILVYPTNAKGSWARWWGHGEPLASLWPQRQATAPNLRARLSSLNKKVKFALKQSTSPLLETSCKTNETAGAYFIDRLRCDEIIFWNLRLLRPVQFISCTYLRPSSFLLYPSIPDTLWFFYKKLYF